VASSAPSGNHGVARNKEQQQYMARDITIARFIPRILQLVNNGKQDILFQNSFPFKVSWFQFMMYSNSIKKEEKMSS